MEELPNGYRRIICTTEDGNGAIYVDREIVLSYPDWCNVVQYGYYVG